MTDIRELLREATDDLTVGAADPIERVRQATVRRQLAWAGGLVAVVIAVVAAIVAPLALTGSTNNRVTTGHSPRPGRAVFQYWAGEDGGAASGFGAIWGVQCCGGSLRPSWVDQLDPQTGAMIKRFAVPGPTVAVATGAGRVWTVGATDGGPSAISVINPTTYQVTTITIKNVKAEPTGAIAFAHGSAWVSFDVTNQVWRLTPTATGVQKTVLSVPGAPQYLATTGDGTLWVSRETEGTDALTEIVAGPTSARLGRSVEWPGGIYSAAGPKTLWASAGQLRTLMQLQPSSLRPVGATGEVGCSACAQTDNIVVMGRQIYTAISTSRGLFVSTFGGPDTPGHTDFFSRHALDTNRETPTARVPAGGSLAPDGDGVVIGDGSTGLVHWVPGF